jgi:hypothetical protein
MNAPTNNQEMCDEDIVEIPSAAASAATPARKEEAKQPPELLRASSARSKRPRSNSFAAGPEEVSEEEEEKKAPAPQQQQKFILNGKRFHFTFRGWINKENLKKHLKIQGTELEECYIAWEEGEEAAEGQDTVPYKHTHCLLKFRNRVKKDGVNFNLPRATFGLDTAAFGPLDATNHPNIKPISDDRHWNNTRHYLLKGNTYPSAQMRDIWKANNADLLEQLEEADQDLEQRRKQAAERKSDEKTPITEKIINILGAETNTEALLNNCHHINEATQILAIRNSVQKGLIVGKVSQDLRQPLGWQVDFLANIQQWDQNNRQIIWIYDEATCTGKSEYMLRKLMADPEKDWANCGGAQDEHHLCNMLTGLKRAKEWSGKRTICDIPKSEKLNGILLYTMLEKLKNGNLQSGKYQGSALRGDALTCVIFSNGLPDTDKLSDDKLLVYTIRKRDGSRLSKPPRGVFADPQYYTSRIADTMLLLMDDKMINEEQEELEVQENMKKLEKEERKQRLEQEARDRLFKQNPANNLHFLAGLILPAAPPAIPPRPPAAASNDQKAIEEEDPENIPP